MRAIRIFSSVGLVILSVLAIGIGVRLVQADSGIPAWPTFHHNLQRTGQSPYQGPQNAGLAWSFPLEGYPGAPIIGSDGTIYLSTGWLHDDTVGYLYAINPDGTQKWRTTLAILPGYSAPALAPDGTIYVFGSGTEGNIAAVEKFYSIDPVDGSINWTFLPNGNLGIFTTLHPSSPAVVADGTIYFGSMNTDFFALNPDGTVKWWDSPSATSFASSPSVAPNGTVYIVDECTRLFAYSPSGVLLWQYSLSTACGENYSAPTIGADGTIYVGEPVNKSLHAVNPDGTSKWSFPTGHEIESTVAIGTDGTIFLGSDGLYAINPDGTQKWHFATPYDGGTSPILGSDGMIYWRTWWDYYMIRSDGTQRFTFDMGSSLAWGQDSVIGSDGTLYVPYADDFAPANNSLKAYRTVPLPDPFSKISPADDSLDQPVSISLRWESTPGAVSYSSCYYKAGGSCSWFNNGTSTTRNLSGLLRNTTYYWQVKALNSMGDPIEANDGTIWSFTTIPNAPAAFSKITPASSSSGVAIYPSLNLTWETSTGATSYQYCVYPQGSSCAEWTTTTQTSAQVTGLLSNQMYYWRVIAENTGGTTEANGLYWWFRSASLPVSFSKTNPTNAAVNVPLTPTLVWGTSSGATDYEYCYDDSNNSTCNDTWRSAGLSNSVTLSELQHNTTYYWQVRSVGPGGLQYANTSIWWSFTTIPTAPDAFNKSSPADGSIDQPTNLTLNWNPATGATHYEYCYYSSNPADCNEPWALTTTSTSVNLSGLSTSTTYHWQVRAVNAGGTTEADGGTWWTFTTLSGAPATFGKSTPINGAVNQSLTPTLSWAASADATHYEYCYYSSNPADCNEPWTLNTTSTSINLSGLALGTTYHWQVRAVNAGGTTEADSGVWWSFATRSQSKLYSIATQDGWMLESTETSNAGGTMNASATTFNLGDGTADKQYRSILSFNTTSLPDTAVITKVTLKIRAYGALVGNNNPFTWGQGLRVDVCKGTFGTSALQLTDFNYNNATNCKLLAGTFGSTPTSGWYSVNLVSAARSKINLTGTTQFRLRFYKDDNDDNASDYWRFYSGNYANVNLRPTLIIEYYVP